MRRRAFIQATAAALVGSLGVRAFGESTSRNLSVDTRPEDVARRIVRAGAPRRATRTDGGLVLDYSREGMKLRYVQDALAGTFALRLQRDGSWWAYTGRSAAGRRRLVLDTYANSLGQGTFRREAFDAWDDPEGTAWFAGHATQVRRIVGVLATPGSQAWVATSQELRARLSALRAELDVDKNTEVAPGEASRITLSGGTDDTRGDSCDLRHDLVRDRFQLRVTAAPRDEAHADLAPHTEKLILQGDAASPNGRLDGYRMISWRDESLGLTWSTKRGGEHPLFAAKERWARLVIGFFPRLL